MNNKPLVSIVITTFKTDNLSRAIDSIINQTYSNIELIVVDDNDAFSQERKKTESIMNYYKKNDNIFYFKHKHNKNGAAARNTGISKAKGKYICFLDDDDFYLPTRIEKSVDILEKNNKFDGVIVSVLYYNWLHKYYNSLNSTKSGSLQIELFTNNNVLGTGSNIFIRRSCLEKIIEFDERFDRFQDVEFMIRFFDYFKVISIDEYLIVKDVKINNRKPNYKKKKKSVEIFLNKFSDKIEKMNEDIKNKVFYSFYYLLYFSASNRDEINESKKQLKKYGNISIKVILKKNILKYLPYNYIPRRDKLSTMSKKMSRNDFEYARKIQNIETNTKERK